MYDDLNTLSRQLKVDNFSFLEIEETAPSNSEQLSSDIATTLETTMSDKKDSSLTTIEKISLQDHSTTKSEFTHFINSNDSHYYNKINVPASHTEQAIILSVLFSSISKNNFHLKIIL